MEQSICKSDLGDGWIWVIYVLNLECSHGVYEGNINQLGEVDRLCIYVYLHALPLLWEISIKRVLLHHLHPLQGTACTPVQMWKHTHQPDNTRWIPVFNISPGPQGIGRCLQYQLWMG
jgi:hypothetical protein